MPSEGRCATAATYPCCGETGGTFGGAFSPWIETVGTIVAGWVMPFEGRRATADTYPRCGETDGTFVGTFSLRMKPLAPLSVLSHLGLKPVAPLSVLLLTGVQPLAPLLIINGCFGGILHRQRCWGFHPTASVSRRWWHWFHLLVDESGERHR